MKMVIWLLDSELIRTILKMSLELTYRIWITLYNESVGKLPKRLYSYCLSLAIILLDNNNNTTSFLRMKNSVRLFYLLLIHI